jgi:hypothetical protein
MGLGFGARAVGILLYGGFVMFDLAIRFGRFLLVRDGATASGQHRDAQQ